MDILISLILVIILQCVHTLNHQVVCVSVSGECVWKEETRTGFVGGTSGQ